MNIDPFMLSAIITIASCQAKAKQVTKYECILLMDYSASNPLSIIQYHTNYMVLYVHSDMSYLSKTCTRSHGVDNFSSYHNPSIPPNTCLTYPPQRSCTHHVKDHWFCCCLSHRVWNWYGIFELPRCHYNHQNPHRTCSPVTTHPNAIWQYHFQRVWQWHYETKKF